MNYNIKSLKGLIPDQGKTYLFDTNVWKLVLIAPPDMDDYLKSYVNFFDAVTSLSKNDQCKNKPMIYINGLILSEVYNACIKTHCEAYNKSEGKSLKPKEYRSTDHFKSTRAALLSDFAVYRNCMVLESDLIEDPFEVMVNIPEFSDYNDHYYFRIAHSKNISIVTGDGDFKYEQVEIITGNNKLLKLMR